MGEEEGEVAGDGRWERVGGKEFNRCANLPGPSTYRLM